MICAAAAAVCAGVTVVASAVIHSLTRMASS
jgi:hypothetical protein